MFSSWINFCMKRPLNNSACKLIIKSCFLLFLVGTTANQMSQIPNRETQTIDSSTSAFDKSCVVYSAAASPVSFSVAILHNVGEQSTSIITINSTFYEVPELLVFEIGTTLGEPVQVACQRELLGHELYAVSRKYLTSRHWCLFPAGVPIVHVFEEFCFWWTMEMSRKQRYLHMIGGKHSRLRQIQRGKTSTVLNDLIRDLCHRTLGGCVLQSPCNH